MNSLLSSALLFLLLGGQSSVVAYGIEQEPNSHLRKGKNKGMNNNMNMNMNMNLNDSNAKSSASEHSRKLHDHGPMLNNNNSHSPYNPYNPNPNPYNANPNPYNPNPYNNDYRPYNPYNPYPPRPIFLGPTPLPTDRPTPAPTRRPTDRPTPFPTFPSTPKPTTKPPTPIPTPPPTTASPTSKPIATVPSQVPSASQAPSGIPSAAPSGAPSEKPTTSAKPSETPTTSEEPSENPTNSDEPSENPTLSSEPSAAPFIISPSSAPSSTPSVSTNPSLQPSPVSMTRTIVEIICSEPAFIISCRLVQQRPGLLTRLVDNRQFTMFVPVNEAWSRFFDTPIREFLAGNTLPRDGRFLSDVSDRNLRSAASGDVVAYLKELGIDIETTNTTTPVKFLFDLSTNPEGSVLEEEILLAHVIDEKKVLFEDLTCGAVFNMADEKVETKTECSKRVLAQEKFQVASWNIASKDLRPKILEQRSDIMAKNGVIHAIDFVIFPNFWDPKLPDPSTSPSMAPSTSLMPSREPSMMPSREPSSAD